MGEQQNIKEFVGQKPFLPYAKLIRQGLNEKCSIQVPHEVHSQLPDTRQSESSPQSFNEDEPGWESSCATSA